MNVVRTYLAGTPVENVGVQSETYEPLFIEQFTSGAQEPCEFCEPLISAERSAFDLAWPLGEIALKPALGMLVPGYFMAVTREHMTSFAQLSPDALTNVDSALRKFERTAGSVFSEYFRFEHGSDNIDTCGVGSGGCVTHAHQHIVPGEEAAEHMRSALDWDELDSIGDLIHYRGAPYMYMAQGNRHFAKAEPWLHANEPDMAPTALPSQWGRRIIASTYGAAIYDWAVRSEATNLAATLIKLDMLPPATLVLDANNDRLVFSPTEPGPGVLSRLDVLPDKITGLIPGPIAELLTQND